MSLPKVRLKFGQFAVLTLTEPWASFVVWREKMFETRSCPTGYRGLLLIQAKTMPTYAQRMCFDDPFERVLMRHNGRLPLARPEDVAGGRGQRQFGGFRFGAIIGAAVLTDSIRTEKVEVALKQADNPRAIQELAFGMYGTGRRAFRLERAESFREPIPVRGSLGIWTLEDPALCKRVDLQISHSLIEFGESVSRAA
jgi:activating signal cointegrator 1